MGRDGLRKGIRLISVLKALLLSIALGCAGAGTVAAPNGPAVTVGNAAFEVEVADTPQLRSKGLSGRDGLPGMSGMIFVFEFGRTSNFWMKGMMFPIDFVWIGEECTVVDTHSNVQPSAAGTSDGELPLYRSSSPAVYTLEVNAGKVVEFGIEVGDPVRFSGFSGEGIFC